MKKHCLLFASFLTACITLQAQTTIVLQPNANAGKDAFVWDYNPTTNYGSDTRLDITAWTASGTPYISRAFVQFDLSGIPAGAVVKSAHLSLYHNDVTTNYSGIHSGANASVIQRVTSAWQENTITWNNKPSTSVVNELNLPATTSGTQDFLNLDVKNLVVDMVNNPTTSFGFMMRLQTEQFYSDLLFFSSDHSVASLRPKLVITYDTAVTYLILQPDSTTGNDAFVWDYSPNLNFGNDYRLDITAWTASGTPYISRAFIGFDLSGIPAGATVTGAFLSLYHNNTATNYGGLHSGANASVIQRVTSAWQENTITWNNKPSTTALNQLSLPATITGTEDFLNLDVKNLVVDMLNNPTTSFGFMMRLQTEQFYRDLTFLSSENSTPGLRPKLVISYIQCTPPNAGITATGSTTFCSGGSVVLNAPVNANYAYQWRRNGVNISGATAQSYIATTGGNYKVTVTKTNTGCTKITPTAKVVTVNALPSAAATPQGPVSFCAGGSVVLQANTGVGLTYKWKKNGTYISGATATSYTATTAGTYKVEVKNVNTCSMLSSGIVVTVPCRDGETNSVSSNDIQANVYPNPYAETFTLLIDGNENEKFDLTIKDISGRIVSIKKTILSGTEIQLGENLEPGFYLVEVVSGEKRKVVRIEKM